MEEARLAPAPVPGPSLGTASKLASLFPPPPPSTRASLGLLLLRLVVGVAFMEHGWSKIQDPFNWMGARTSTPGTFQALAARGR
ncbi:DoxX family membrane protein [Corallococcus terminator]